MANPDRETVAESTDKVVKVVQYPNGDYIVRFQGIRLTVERFIFDKNGGNIVLRRDTRPSRRDEAFIVIPKAAGVEGEEEKS
jgi:hypothetical protein